MSGGADQPKRLLTCSTKVACTVERMTDPSPLQTRVTKLVPARSMYLRAYACVRVGLLHRLRQPCHGSKQGLVYYTPENKMIYVYIYVCIYIYVYITASFWPQCQED